MRWKELRNVGVGDVIGVRVYMAQVVAEARQAKAPPHAVERYGVRSHCTSAGEGKCGAPDRERYVSCPGQDRQQWRALIPRAPIGVGYIEVGNPAKPRADRQRDPEIPDHQVGASRVDKSQIVLDIAKKFGLLIQRLAASEGVDELAAWNRMQRLDPKRQIACGKETGGVRRHGQGDLMATRERLSQHDGARNVSQCDRLAKEEDAARRVQGVSRPAASVR